MSYGQYSRRDHSRSTSTTGPMPTVTPATATSQATSVTSVSSVGFQDDSQSGSFNLGPMLGSTTKHVRRMGRIKNRMPPQRMTFGGAVDLPDIKARHKSDTFAADPHLKVDTADQQYKLDTFTSERYKSDTFASDRHVSDNVASDRHKSDSFASDRHISETFASERHQKADTFSSDRQYKLETLSSERHQKIETLTSDRYKTDSYALKQAIEDRERTPRSESFREKENRDDNGQRSEGAQWQSNYGEKELVLRASSADRADNNYRNAKHNNHNKYQHSSYSSSHLPQILAMTPFREGPRDHNVIMVQGHAYAILKIIGKGGSSVVYEVYDQDRNLRAIKKVDLSEADEAQAQGYLNEINMLEKLQGHHRIVRLYEYEFRRSEDLLLVVMERGDTDLSSLLKRMETISPVQRMFYWSEMLEAVQVIHNAGIIHSDLKPANFLIVGGTIKLIDFGIASSVQSDKTSVFKDNQMGTFNFMSPEAIEDLSPEDGGENHKPRIKISRKSDIWSLGCILYNLTFGKMPFGHIKHPMKKLEAIINPNHQIAYPSQDHDPELVDTIQRCLVRDPAKRASVEELLNHPYLKQKSNNAEKNNLDVEAILSKLGHVLTPNTKSGLTRAVKKLSSSDTNLEALRRFDLT